MSVSHGQICSVTHLCWEHGPVIEDVDLSYEIGKAEVVVKVSFSYVFC